jgi:hypothetical protein
VPRRASLPGADLLFGSAPQPKPARSVEAVPATEAPTVEDTPVPKPAPVRSQGGRSQAGEAPRPSPAPAEPAGAPVARPRHAEKVTFYCTDSDLTRLEAARLDLRANHKLASDRGRIVRAAIAEILDDFDARGADSLLVKRLSSE